VLCILTEVLINEYGIVSKTKWRKNNIGVNVSRAEISGVLIFKRSGVFFNIPDPSHPRLRPPMSRLGLVFLAIRTCLRPAYTPSISPADAIPQFTRPARVTRIRIPFTALLALH